MMIVGLIILVAAVIVGVAGVLSNSGSGHALGHGWAVFGYHVTGSTGTLFLYGIAVGVVAVFGLSLLLAAARRTSRRGRDARRNLRDSRSQTAAVSQDRDDLVKQRDAALAQVPSVPVNGSDDDDDSSNDGDAQPGPAINRPSWLQLPGHRNGSGQDAATSSEPVTEQSDAKVPADASAATE